MESHNLNWKQGTYILFENLPVKPQVWFHKNEKVIPELSSCNNSEFQHGFPQIDCEGFIVISQSCDVKKDTKLFQVELASVIKSSSKNIINLSQKLNSSEYFFLKNINDSEALIINYGWRCFVDKGLQTQVKSDNSIIDSLKDNNRDMLLAGWLGQRNGRIAVPDEEDKKIVSPIRSWHKDLRKKSENLKIH